MTGIFRNQVVTENFNANSAQRAARARMRRLRLAAAVCERGFAVRFEFQIDRRRR